MDKEAQRKIVHPPTDQIGNLSGDEYSLSCTRCGSINDLHQVAFRNVNKGVIGYVFACRKCEPLIFNKCLGELLGYRKLPEGEPPIIHADGCSTNLGIIGAVCNCGAEVQRDSDIKWYKRA